MLMRAGAIVAIATVGWACGGPLPTSGAATGIPNAVAQVRLFDVLGRDLTVHTGLPDDQSVRVEVRLYARDGHRLTDIVGGVEFGLQFTPESLATSVAVPDRPLERIITPTTPSGTSGSQTVSWYVPRDASSKSFGPFHVQVQRGDSGGARLRLFDDLNAELTQHIPLLTGDTTRIETRLYDAEGRRRTSIPGGVEITFRFEPPTVATATPVAGMPFWKKVTPTAAIGTEGSLFVSVLFLADSVTRTYGPTQVLVH
jgi:hypothetical protein